MECRLRRSTGFGHRGTPQSWPGAMCQGQVRTERQSLRRRRFPVRLHSQHQGAGQLVAAPAHEGYELAKLIGRDFKKCPGDLKLLEKYGLVRLDRGRRTGKRVVRAPRVVYSEFALKIAI